MQRARRLDCLVRMEKLAAALRRAVIEFMLRANSTGKLDAVLRFNASEKCLEIDVIERFQRFLRCSVGAATLAASVAKP